MGSVISSTASADDILADAATALRLARERRGVMASEAERFLAGVLQESREVLAERRVAERDALVAREAVDAQVRRSRLLIGASYDELWNRLERPASDTRLAQWFPNASATCTVGPTEGMAIRMRILASSIQKKPHPLLPLDRCLEIAAEIERAADRLAEVLAAAVDPANRELFYGQMYLAMAKGAHTQLAALKRTLLGLGYRQTQIHEIIPDRPTSKKARGQAVIPEDETDPEDGEAEEAAPVPESDEAEAPAPEPTPAPEPSPAAEAPVEAAEAQPQTPAGSTVTG